SARSPEQHPPVVIVGKGPSARYVPPGAGAFRVAALNGAVRLCTWADWLFVNDLSAFAEIAPDDLRRHTGRVVLPAELHIDLGKPRASPRAAIPFLRGRPYDLFELHTNPDRSPKLPYFGAIGSVAESAVAWLLHLGYRRFYTLGIDPQGGYSQYFAQGQ